MNSLLVFCSFLLFVPFGFAQQITLKGQVTILNSQHHSGKTEYVSDAWVSADSGTSVITDEKGRFSITLVGKSAGNSAAVTVQKDGLEVVNPADLQQVILGRKRPLRVFLADPKDLVRVQAELYEVSLNAMTARHRELVALLREGGAIADSVVTALKAQLNREFEHRWAAEDFLTEQLKEMQKRLPETVRDLARVNLDFASERYLEAWKAFCEGDVEGVFQLMSHEVLDQESRESARRLTLSQSNGLLSSQAENSLHERAQQLINAYKLKAEAHNLLFQYKQAAEVFEKAIELLEKVKDGVADLELGEAYGELGDFRFQNGEYHLSEGLVLRELKIKEGFFPNGNPLINHTKVRLAEIYRLQSKLPLALEVMLQAAPEGGDSEKLADHFNNLTGIYLDLGEYEKAMEAGNEAMRHLATLDSVAPIKLAKHLNNMAIIERSFGLQERALQTLEKALDQVIGDSTNFPLELGEMWGNLAILRYELKNYKEAFHFAEKSSLILCAHLESNHPRIGLSYHLLSLIYQKLGKHKEAIDYNERSIVILENTLGKDHFRYASALNDLSLLYKIRGNTHKALEIALKCLRLREQNFGPQHPDLAISHNNLGRIYIALGEFELALEHMVKSHEIRVARLEPFHPKIALSLTGLATVYRELGRIEEALEKAIEAWEFCKANFPEDHPSMFNPLLELGKIYRYKKDYQKAKDVLEKALEVMNLTPEQDSLNRLGVLHSLAAACAELGEFPKALELLDDCLAILHQKLDSNHLSFGGMYNEYSLVYEDMEDFPKALEYQQKCLANFELNYPPDHPNIAIGYHNLAIVQAALEDFDRAIESEELALSIFQKKLPPEHRNNVKSKIKLSAFYYKRAFSLIDESPDLALHDFETALDYHPVQPKYLICIAMCHERLGQVELVGPALLHAQTMPPIDCSYFEKPIFAPLHSHPQFISLLEKCSTTK